MAVFVAAWEKDVLPRFTRNPVVLVISIDVSPAPWRGADTRTEPRQTHNVGGLKPQFPGI
jgi:hypothetical protein